MGGNVRPIEHDELGELYGRDCIFLDVVLQTGSTLKLKGEINGHLASKIQEDIWIPYELIFRNVIKYSSCELDTYEADESEVHGISGGSLLMIEGSDYLKKIPVRYDYPQYDYKHFQVCTYDFIFNVFAVDYELKCDVTNARKRH